MNIFKLITAISVGSFLGGAAVIGTISWLELRAAASKHEQAMAALLAEEERIGTECDSIKQRIAELSASRDQTTIEIVQSHKTWVAATNVPGANKDALNEVFLKKKRSLEMQKQDFEEKKRIAFAEYSNCTAEIVTIMKKIEMIKRKYNNGEMKQD